MAPRHSSRSIPIVLIGTLTKRATMCWQENIVEKKINESSEKAPEIAALSEYIHYSSATSECIGDRAGFLCCLIEPSEVEKNSANYDKVVPNLLKVNPSLMLDNDSESQLPSRQSGSELSESGNRLQCAKCDKNLR